MARKIIFTVINDLNYDQRMERICTSLAGAGYEVVLVGRELPASLAVDNRSYKQHRLRNIFNKGKLFYMEYNIRLFFYLLFHKADIISAIDLDTIIACYWAAKIKGAKVVYDAHEYFPEVPEVVRRPRIQAFWRWVERTYVPLMNMVYTSTQSIAQVFSINYKVQATAIRNLPRLQPASSENHSHNKYIIYQGALNEGRGLESLLEAMLDIDIELWLVGEGDISKQLKEQVSVLGLADKVKFLGYVKPEALKKITANAFIGINLLEKKGLSYYYSLANKFLDYIQAGVPQVSMSFPEYKRINDEYNIALLIENLTKDAIKVALLQLITNNELYSTLHQNCLNSKGELCWEMEERKLIEIYERIG